MFQNRKKVRKVNKDKLAVFDWCHGNVPLREIPVNRLNFAKTKCGAIGLAAEIFDWENLEIHNSEK